MNRFRILAILSLTFAFINMLVLSSRAGEPKGKVMKGHNLLIDASANLLNAAVKRQIDRTDPVQEIIQDSPVQGTGRTTGAVTAELIPDARKAVIEVVFRGQVNAQTVATRPFVLVHTTSATPVEVRRRVVIDGKGIHSSPGENFGKSTVSLNSITPQKGPEGIVVRVATQAFNRTLSDVEQDTAIRAAWQVSRRMGNEIAPALTSTSKASALGLNSLKRAGLSLEALEFNTTAAALQGRMRFATPGVEASPSPAPSDGLDLGLRVHQSLVNQVLQSMYGGKSISLSELQKFHDDVTQGFIKDGRKENVQQAGLKSIGKLLTSIGSTPTVTFAQKDPITIGFSEQGIVFEIDIISIQQDANLYEGMRVRTEYGIENSKDGIQLVRKGPVRFLPSSAADKKLAGQPISFTIGRELLFAEVLKERFTVGSLPLPELGQEMRFQPPRAGARDGWLAIGLNLAQ